MRRPALLQQHRYAHQLALSPQVAGVNEPTVCHTRVLRTQQLFPWTQRLHMAGCCGYVRGCYLVGGADDIAVVYPVLFDHTLLHAVCAMMIFNDIALHEWGPVHPSSLFLLPVVRTCSLLQALPVLYLLSCINTPCSVYSFLFGAAGCGPSPHCLCAAHARDRAHCAQQADPLPAGWPGLPSAAISPATACP